MEKQPEAEKNLSRKRALAPSKTDSVINNWLVLRNNIESIRRSV